MPPVADRTTNGSPVPASGFSEAVGGGHSLRRLASDRVARALFGRTFLGADGTYRRDLHVALGYKRELEVQDYRGRYERGGIAERLVELMPRETWGAEGFDLVENPDPGVSTPFEEAFVDLADRLDLWSRLLRADIVAGWGRYSAILIGAPGSLETPMPRMSGPDDILYLKVLAEDRAKIESLVKDSEDPRFGAPEFYTLQLGGEEAGSLSFGGATSSLLTKKAHWTRIIHVAEGLLEDDVYGKPRLRAVWNYLDDLAKVAGGGAEATWKRLHPRTIFDLDPEVGDLSAEAEEALVDEIEEIVHDLKEHAITRGVTPHLLSHTVQAFGPNAHAILDLICATLGVPKRIFLGSERGELASTQDRNDFTRGPVDSRRQGFAAPLVREFTDRLIEHGALPEPTEYEVVLPALDELPEDEQAEIVSKFAAANQANVAAGGGLVITANEMRDAVLSLGPIEEIEDTGTEALDEPEDDGDEEPAVTVNTSLRAAKLRLCKARGILPQPRAAFDLTDAPPDEPEWKAVHRAADAHRERFARAVAGAWADAADSLGLEALTDALERGQEEATQLALSALDDVEARLQETLPDLILGVLVAGGEAALRSARSRGSWFRGAASFRGAAFEASFNQTNPRALAWAQDRSSGLITEIHPDTVAAIQDLIAQGFREGIPPRALARRIRQTIGLRSDQAQAIANLAADLRSAEPGALIERFPPRAGIRSQAGFRVRVPAGGATEEWVEQQVARYSRMQLNLRARTIARRETVFSANQGQRELWFQAQESGQIPSDQKRVWIATPDDRVRPEHLERDGHVVGVNEPWPWGTEPGEEVACRCSQGLATPEDLERLAAARASKPWWSAPFSRFSGVMLP